MITFNCRLTSQPLQPGILTACHPSGADPSPRDAAGRAEPHTWQRPHYLLRYYLDFRHKYSWAPMERENPPASRETLRARHQPEPGNPPEPPLPGREPPVPLFRATHRIRQGSRWLSVVAMPEGHSSNCKVDPAHYPMLNHRALPFSTQSIIEDIPPPCTFTITRYHGRFRPSFSTGRHHGGFRLAGSGGAFTRLFAQQGVDLTLTRRGTDGHRKREHIRRLCALPRVAAAWRELYGATPDTAAIDRSTRIYPLQVAAIRDSAQLVPAAGK